MSDALEAIRQLEQADLSPEGRKKVMELRNELESKTPETWLDRFRRRVWSVLRWSAVPLAVGLTGGYVVKQAIDASPYAVEAAAKREVNERIGEIKTTFEDMRAASGSLLLRLVDFMIALKDAVSTYHGASSLVVGVWDGLWADGDELIKQGDLSPDKILGKLMDFVSSNAELAQKMDGIFAAYEDLKKKRDAFEISGKRALEFNDQDAHELWKDYKREFWTEMFNKRKSLSEPTSARAPESPKP